MAQPASPWTGLRLLRRLTLGFVGIAGAAMLGLLALRTLPLSSNLLAPRQGVEIRDRHGVVIVARPDAEGLRAREVMRVPADLEAVVLAAEDHRFHTHLGIDPRGVARAAWTNLRARRVRQGGSTVTQQLARALVPRSPGLLGKLDEAVLALRLEGHLDKDAILRMYLSRAWYGNGAVGAEEAARVYFDRPLASLSLAQSATLAAIPRRPLDLDPYRAPRRVRAARDGVLARARALGWISAEREAIAVAEPLALARGDLPTEAPHFVRRVLEGAHAPGAVVVTTLDLDLQRRVERVVAEEVARLGARGVSQGAVVVLDTSTRDVLAYVGSAGWTTEQGQVDGVRALRSPGSALKPFLYALALEQPGATLADVVPDLPGTWTTAHGNWRPQNYEAGSGGPVRLREALARSLNLPAIRLAERVGVGNLLHRLRSLGVESMTDDPSHYGLALVVGSGEARLDQLTAAYAALGDRGRFAPARWRLDLPPAAPRQVIAPEAAFLVADALDDPGARMISFGRDSDLEPAFPWSTKTGTSTAWRDNWTFGTNDAITVGVWVGNFDGRPMGEVGGVTGAAPIARRVAELAMEQRRASAPLPPAASAPRGALVRGKVCPLSGARATSRCDGGLLEWLPSNVTREPCAWHTDHGVELPAEYASWAAANSARVSSVPGGAPRVQYPPDRSAFWLDTGRPSAEQAIPLRASAQGRHAEWRVDDVVVAEADAPFQARWVPTPGDHLLRVRVDGRDSPAVRVWVGASTRGMKVGVPGRRAVP